MAGFLRKLFGHQQNPRSTNEDTDLQNFYTDSEYALQIFEQLASATNLSKRLLIIHGIGGVGKSALLRMYNLSCHRQRIPSALVASEETASPVDVLEDWADDLILEGITLPTFQKTLTLYRAIQAKVENEASRGYQAKSRIIGTLGKTVAKTAITIAATAILGPVLGSIGGDSADALLDWLLSFLSQPEMELYLDPAKRLDSDFLSDLHRIASRQRIVLITDTYEQMTALDDWMRELARRLPKNVLLVLAGRIVPAWNRTWQDWMSKANVVELKEMTSDDLRTLVQRYYASIRKGEPDPKQVEAIVEFARGLPLVATTVVQLWVKYGLEDFQAVRPQVVADLADRLLEDIPQEIRPAFEVAAVLRYFNAETLGVLLDGGNADHLYAELRRWPFIRSRKEDLAVHDTMREMINEALQVRIPKRFQTLHERAAIYYEARLDNAMGDERERYSLERLYHRVRADEGSGMQLFQQQAEEFTRYRLVYGLQGLLNDVNTYPLKQENSQQWRKYYNANLEFMSGRMSHAEEMYQAIGENKRVESKLRAYALCDWGGTLCRQERIRRQPDMEDKAIHALEASLDLGGAPDLKLATSWLHLSEIYIAKCNWGKALVSLEQPRRFFEACNDYSGLQAVLDQERKIYAFQGNMRKMFDVAIEIGKIYTAAGSPAYLRDRTAPIWSQIWAGRFAELEREYRASIEAVKSLQNQERLVGKIRDLALCLGLQRRCAEALSTAEEGLSIGQSFGDAGEMDIFLALTIYGIACFKCGKLDKAREYLTQAVALAQKIHAHLDITALYLAIVHEVLKGFDEAEYFYQLLYQEAHPLGRHYFECGALTGLVRVKYAQKDYAAILSLWATAEQLAEEYEYNDYLTSLYLIKGHITLEGAIPEWESGFDSALHFYQLTLIYALRYNRFLLDEALSRPEQGTPLQPMIPHCLERGKEGQQMLGVLQKWWQGGSNDIGVSRLETISPIPEDIPLLDAERIARNQEPGDGSLQKSVVEQINTALATVAVR